MRNLRETAEEVVAGGKTFVKGAAPTTTIADNPFMAGVDEATSGEEEEDDDLPFDIDDLKPKTKGSAPKGKKAPTETEQTKIRDKWSPVCMAIRSMPMNTTPEAGLLALYFTPTNDIQALIDLLKEVIKLKSK